MFNPRTHAWQYDVASVFISPPSENISLDSFYCYPPPLRQDTRPRLDADGIVSCFEEQFGDFLHLIASAGVAKHVKDLSDFARHGYLTFGAIVDCNKPEVLAYFPSTPSPKWNCWSFTADVKANYSTSDCDDLYNDLVFIDEVRFSLVGTFQSNPASSTTPAYLFVPPTPVEVVNNVYCIRYPLPGTLFFWCSDPDGQNVIFEENWEAYGIPQLEIITRIGSSWYWVVYTTIQDHLGKKSCTLDGRQYAREHGYPELIYGDPHNHTIAIVKEPDTPEEIDSFSEWSEHQDDANDKYSVPLDQPSSKAPDTQCIEADQINTCPATSTLAEDDQEGPKARITHGLAPSRRSQSHSNEYQPPAWPRAIYELFVLVWSIVVVVLSVGYERVTRAVGSTNPENMGVGSIVETGKETTDARQTD
ncbi:hypothetical protein PM082_022838 [Marasmius tenuissimus]|nr:hypothetical protein PM082_022838 [Marasmius tenuissimus]